MSQNRPKLYLHNQPVRNNGPLNFWKNYFFTEVSLIKQKNSYILISTLIRNIRKGFLLLEI